MTANFSSAPTLLKLFMLTPEDFLLGTPSATLV
jgi:hypothetical protein